MKPIGLDLDLGDKKDEALRFQKHNGGQALAHFLRVFRPRARRPLPPEYLDQPVKNFLFRPDRLKPGEGVELAPAGPPAGGLRDRLDDLWEQEDGAPAESPRSPERGGEIVDGPRPTFPEDIKDTQAVRTAYCHELEAVARYLQHGLSVLIVCDKILTEHIYESVAARAGKKCVLDDAVPPSAAGRGQAAAVPGALQSGPGIEQTIPILLRNLDENQLLVLRSVDLLNTPPLIEALYQGGGCKAQLLGFLDPSLEVKKVLTDRFAVHVALTGLPRYIQPDPDKGKVHTVARLLTAREGRCFRDFDPEGLYKNVAGLNAIQFRNGMKYVGAILAEGTDSRRIYSNIREFKRSSSGEVEIPDTRFPDIGGYDRVKQELQRIIALVTGGIPGLDEEERKRLTPRGLIFHGPPGTGKTLFAKAIANAMNATIQMVSGPEIMDKYVGQSESNLRSIFATARRNAPSVVFFDEFDSIASQRSTYSDGGSRANNAVVAQLLTELDGFREGQAVLVIGTTNRLDIIDEALLRPSRLRPIEIGLPDYQARRSVAEIHADAFGIVRLLEDLGGLALAHRDGRGSDDSLPAAFLEALFELHPGYRTRFALEAEHTGFRRDLVEFDQMVRKAVAEFRSGDGQAASQLLPLQERLQTIARSYGLDLAAPSRPPTDPDPNPDSDSDADATPWREPMHTDLRDLFELTKESRTGSRALSAEALAASTLDLIAEFTEGFNNDEIRAIFQEASLEHHLEGQLITPRYLGTKIGLIRKRRDEREVSHLSSERGRRETARTR
jgi:SpoVK/Ycf46/Vps4 family AAA+-type ATPase